MSYSFGSHFVFIFDLSWNYLVYIYFALAVRREEKNGEKNWGMVLSANEKPEAVVQKLPPKPQSVVHL